MSLFRPTSDDERFYARALGVLSGLGGVVRTIGVVANAAFNLSLPASVGFLAEQLWDRAQPPVSIIRLWADPRVVVAGTPVRQWIKLVRHRRCTYSTS